MAISGRSCRRRSEASGLPVEADGRPGPAVPFQCNTARCNPAKTPNLGAQQDFTNDFQAVGGWHAACEGGGETRKGLTVKHVILSFIRNESGAAAAEYALILAIVGAGIAVAAGNLGSAISSAINSAQSKI